MKLNKEERAEVRRQVREREKLRCEMNLLVIDMKEIIAERGYSRDTKPPEYLAMDAKVEELAERIAELSNVNIAARYGVRQNTISSMTTARHRR